MIKKTKNGLLVEIFVKPNSGRFEVEKTGEGFIIKTKNRAERNMANKEIIKNLSKYFDCEVEIVKGLKSKNKIVLLKPAEKGQEPGAKQAAYVSCYYELEEPACEGGKEEMF